MRKTNFHRIGILFFYLILFGMVFGMESEEYIIGPKDLLEISVFGLDELNTTARVSEDGLITVANQCVWFG